VLRIAVISNDRLLREGLLRIIADETSFSVIGQHDQPTFPAALRDLRPEVLLVDCRLEGALILCGRLKRDGGPAVIVLAADDDEGFAMRALEAGARGILVKTTGPADLIKAIRVVSQGEIWARRHVIATRMEHLAAGGSRSPGESLSQELLSGREREVLLHTATGLSNKELADRLGISEGTVKAHLSRIFQKLGVRGRAELAAAVHGIIALRTERAPAPSLRSPS